MSTPDLKAVRFMASSPSALQASWTWSMPMLIELIYDPTDSSRILELSSKLDHALSQGTAVLVRGWQPQPVVDFDIDQIPIIRPTMEQPVVVQDAYKRAAQQASPQPDLSNVHSHIGLGEFILKAQDAECCMNLLDLPNSHPDVPPFLRRLFDNINALSATMLDTHVSRDGKAKKSDAADGDFIGIQTILFDTWRCTGWDLLTHGGFLTYPHHDASGMCTYVSVRSGTKIWGYLDTPESGKMNRTALFDSWDQVFRDNINLSFTTCAKAGTVLLQRGDTL
ncbi:hypothetical protein HYDPIDRAFT_35036 [Hydnomerulius pinastri MD-312]|uniref:JmjC domain-containing protein n=1 Tax=Hydnomerulius pinastri MD-312 TaxID=994086 RepID=A0A0C2PG79_9AGAM|nr:hypothetical protein HYDPIDRAFT_35036 [Hydnomerulius pinastri MD-312]